MAIHPFGRPASALHQGADELDHGCTDRAHPVRAGHTRLSDHRRCEMKRNFILQQGLQPPNDPVAEAMLYSALQFQPRLIGALALTGVAFQSSKTFLAIGAVLLCSAVAPRRNPFNALYNYTFGAKRGLLLLRSASPRRFAEAMTSSFAIGIGTLWALEHNNAALGLAAVFVLANAAVALRGFCFGAYLFWRLESIISAISGQREWARR